MSDKAEAACALATIQLIVAVPKTRPTDADVDGFLAAIEPAVRRADAIRLDGLMRAASGELPVLWGTSIVGYGQLPYADSRGKETTWPIIAFAPRKAELVLYVESALEAELFNALGPHRRGVSCLYLKRLSDVDDVALRALFDRSVERSREDAVRRGEHRSTQSARPQRQRSSSTRQAKREA